MKMNEGASGMEAPSEGIVKIMLNKYYRPSTSAPCL